MHNTLQTWLDELTEEVEINFSTDVGEQAIANMITFGLSEANLESWGKESVRDFITGCHDLHQIKCAGHTMLFYCWYDEQAGQIRCSAISAIHKTPPFACELQLVDLDVLVNKIFEGSSGLDAEGGKLFIWVSTLK